MTLTHDVGHGAVAQDPVQDHRRENRIAFFVVAALPPGVLAEPQDNVGSDGVNLVAVHFPECEEDGDWMDCPVTIVGYMTGPSVTGLFTADLEAMINLVTDEFTFVGTHTCPPFRWSREQPLRLMDPSASPAAIRREGTLARKDKKPPPIHPQGAGRPMRHRPRIELFSISI